MKTKPQNNSNRLSLIEHFEELRKRLLYSVLILIITSSIAFIFNKQIIAILLNTLESEIVLRNGDIVFVEIMEMFSTSMKVSLLFGFIVAFPFILHQFFLFIIPGLNTKEKKSIFIFFPIVILAFTVGAFFGYFVLIPPAVGFLLNWGGEIADPMIRIGNIINFELRLVFWIGLVFETPLVMMFLGYLNLLKAKQFARFRRVWIVTAFILGAFITPTFDPVNQSFVAIPLIILYELGILGVKLIQRKH